MNKKKLLVKLNKKDMKYIIMIIFNLKSKNKNNFLNRHCNNWNYMEHIEFFLKKMLSESVFVHQ